MAEIAGEEKTVYESRLFEVVKQPVKIEEKAIDFEIARRPPGVRSLIVKEGKILLTKELRWELNDYDWRLPGGKVFDTLKEYKSALKNKKDILSAAMEAAKQECIEEAGIKVKSMEFIHKTSPGGSVEWDLFYFLVKDFEEAERKVIVDEDIISEWKSFDKVKQMCLDNEIKEDRTVAVLLKFLLREEK